MLLQLLNGIEQYPLHEQIIGYILVGAIAIGYLCVFVCLICIAIQWFNNHF